MFVMLLLNLVIQIPELNFSKHFSIKQRNTDPEREYLGNAVSSSPSYSRHVDEEEAVPNLVQKGEQAPQSSSAAPTEP